MSLENLHTHTWRCGHASGDVEDYCEAALKRGFGVLGFSDHTPLPEGRWPRIRMSLNSYPDYIRRVELAKKNFAPLKVYLGLEGEWDPAFKEFYDNEILKGGHLDYFIGAVHFFPFHGDWLYLEEASSAAHLAAYAAQAAETLASGYFNLLAHPDAFLAGYRRWDDNARSCAKDILDAAKACGTVLEINGNGYRKRRQRGLRSYEIFYPHKAFWEMAVRRGVPVSISSDAHAPEELDDGLEACRRLAADLEAKTVTAADMLK